MRILYLVGGNDVIAGGATVRDAAFVAGLREEGHDVVPISLYGPARIEEEADYSTLFRPLGQTTFRRLFPTLLPRLARIPGSITKIFTRPGPAGKHGETRGQIAVSLLSGASKRQKREFAAILEHIAPGGKPDVAVLAGTLLSGLAGAVKNSLGCPVVCLTQGSDRIVEALEEPRRSEARKLIRRNAKLFARVVTSSRYFAIRTTESLALPSSRIKVVPPGIDAKNLHNPAPRRRLPFTVGCMAPIRKDKGLDILIDAVESLARDTAAEPELWISGRVEDERYWTRLQRRLEGAELKARHRVFGSLAGAARRDFLEGLSVFAVPSREPESRATHMLEAMAAGVPVVGPASGIIPEIFQYANGGLLVSSEAPAWMFAQALELLASMPDTADEMGRVGSEGVEEYFSIGSSARRLAEILREAIEA